MNEFGIILPIIFPLIVGVLVLTAKFESRREREVAVFIAVILNTIFSFNAMFNTTGKLDIFTFQEMLSISLKIDGLSRIFGTMVSILWVITAIYAFEYMTHEGSENRFFAFFLATYGVVLGIAYSGNFLTMYLFYEFLTLVTLQLVMHTMDSKARYAGKMYITYMMFGAALVITGFIFLYNYGESMDFVYGGVLSAEKIKGNEEIGLIIFTATFFGFGVKAAVLPVYRWLPKASIAPTPVTALLHAVAVVKSGVFAITRTIYFSFGTEILINTWVQNILILTVTATIIYGSAVALKTPHIKRRFAYSTISNLSYILFGIVLMTPSGLGAGLLHMVYHAFIKITLFFCAGAILYKTHKEYLYEIEGFGYKMPIVFIAMTIAGISLAGIPPFAGFNSKWLLATAGVESNNPFAYLGIFALIVSSVLTALYMFYILVRGFIPRNIEHSEEYYHNAEDPNLYMTIPLVILSIMILVMGLFPNEVLEIFKRMFLEHSYILYGSG